VAKFAVAFARRQRVPVISLVRRGDAADELVNLFPGLEVINTAEADWEERLIQSRFGERIRVVLDAVGGELGSTLLHHLMDDGALIAYGNLSDEPLQANSLSFAMRRTHITGVAVGRFPSLPKEVRDADIATVLQLAQEEPHLFGVEAEYELCDIAAAVRHAEKTGKAGAVLLTSYPPVQ
jgi:NADPH:quinone reductase-like Zn-dependent oxidoreductase